MQQVQNSHIVQINDWPWQVPTSINQCGICLNGLGEVAICDSGDTICHPCFNSCFDRLEKCPYCKKDLLARHIAQTPASISAQTRLFHSTLFNCAREGCGLPVEYQNLEKHREECQAIKRACEYGCGKLLVLKELDDHKQKCGKRPWQEGSLHADYETINEVKKLKSDCEAAVSRKQPFTETQKTTFLERLITLFPLTAEAALKTPEHPAPGAETLTCRYKCGYITGSQGEISSHYLHCPDRPVHCRHCDAFCKAKVLMTHENTCFMKPVICSGCTESIPRKRMKKHQKECPDVRIKCTLCSALVRRRIIEDHQDFTCPDRSILCRYCSAPITPRVKTTHNTECLFQKPITLGKDSDRPITLLPQRGAECPAYQPEGEDSSTIYFPVLQSRITLSNQSSILVGTKEFTLAGRPVYFYDCMQSHEAPWKACFYYDMTDKPPFSCQLDFIDANNDVVISLQDSQNQENSIVKPEFITGCLSRSRMQNTGVLKKEEIRNKLIMRKYPDNLLLLRVKVVPENS